METIKISDDDLLWDYEEEEKGVEVMQTSSELLEFLRDG